MLKTVVLAVLVLFNVLIALRFVIRFKSSNSIDSSDISSFTRSDHPSLFPLTRPANPVALTVEDSIHYTLPPQKIWESILPLGGGHIHLGADQQLLAVAMIHQLHCIIMLRDALTGSNDTHHPQHCLNYLRQFILCNPDLTLERGDFMAAMSGGNDSGTSYGDGGGATHVCRDWTAAWESMEDNVNDWVDWKLATANSVASNDSAMNISPV